ncbi:hypothetical protein Tco_0621581 [Tanacetum coccineum]
MDELHVRLNILRLASSSTKHVADEVVYKELDDKLVMASITASSLEAEDEESLGKDASKHGRINAIDADEYITLVNDQDDADMFDVNTLIGDEVLAEQEVAAKDVNLTVDKVTLAQALAALKSVKPKVKGEVIKEPSVPVSPVSTSTQVSAATTTTTATILTPRKGIVITELEEPVKMKKKDQISFDKQEAKRLQAEFDEEERLAREKDEANVALTKEWDDIQAKVDDDTSWLKDCKLKNKSTKRAEEKRNKPPTQAQQRKIMCTYLKNMEGKKPKDLKNKSFDSIHKMFDRAFKRVNTFVDFRTYLVEGSSKRAGDELEQESAKKQKVDDDKETAELKQCLEVIPKEEEVAIDVIPLATKSPSIVDWKIHK